VGGAKNGMADAVDTVLSVVGAHFGVSADDIRSLRRTRQVLPARHIAAYLAHTVSGMAPREVGDRLGGRDYTNILMYCRAVARRAEEDEGFRRLLHQLEEAVRM
jgi:chromosomal replication initiator protein